MIEVNKGFVRQAARDEKERELFEALDIGLQTSMAACRAIAVHRGESRWFQLGYVISTIWEKCKLLRHGRRLAPLTLPDNALNGIKLN